MNIEQTKRPSWGNSKVSLAIAIAVGFFTAAFVILLPYTDIPLWVKVIFAVTYLLVGISSIVFLFKTPKAEIIPITTEINKEIDKLTKNIEQYKGINLEKIKEWVENIHLPKKLWKRLKEVESLLSKYQSWFCECQTSIDIKMEYYYTTTSPYKHLKDDFKAFEIGYLWEVLKTHTSKLILQGNLDVKRLKEDILEFYGRSTEATIKDGGEKKVLLKDIVNSQDFHNLINAIKKDLEQCLTIKTLREYRKFALSVLSDVRSQLKGRGG